MADMDREIGGIRCREVLARLSDYLDGELPQAEAARLEAHIRSCDWCERFGGRMGRIVGALRTTLDPPLAVPAPVAARLTARLRRERER